MYYFSANDAFSIDKEAYEADYGPTDWSVYENPLTGGISTRDSRGIAKRESGNYRGLF